MTLLRLVFVIVHDTASSSAIIRKRRTLIVRPIIYPDETAAASVDS